MAEEHGQARAEAAGRGGTDPGRAAGPLPGGAAGDTPVMRYRKPGDRRNRPQRWKDAVAELIEL